MGRNKQINFVDEIRIICFKYGRRVGMEYRLGIPRQANIIIDGRQFADEYEDLDSEAYCRIDSIQASVNHESISFHMHTAFTTSFPLMSNDWYNGCSLDVKTLEKILQTIQLTTEDEPLNPEFTAEMHRQQWVGVAKKYGRIFPTFNNKDHTSDLMHSVDCCFCCNHSVTTGKVALQTYRNLITKETACLIRILYRDSYDFESDMYLSNQLYERQYLQYLWFKEIWPLIEEHCPDSLLDFILYRTPKEVLKPGSFTFNDTILDTYNSFQQQANNIVIPENVLDVNSVTWPTNGVENLQLVINEQLQVGKHYWYVEEKEHAIQSIRLVKITSNECRISGDIPFPLSDTCDTHRPFEWSLKHYCTRFTSGDICSLIKCIDVKTDERLTIYPVFDGVSGRTQNSRGYYEYFYALDEEQYDIVVIKPGNKLHINADKSYLQSKAELSAAIKSKFELLFNLRKAYFQLHATEQKLRTIKVDGLQWTLTTIKSRTGEPTHKRGYDLAETIPYGYRLPTQKELQLLLEKHPFTDEFESDGKVVFTNNIGMKISSDSRTCGMNWSSRNIQPVLWTSFDEPLIKDNAIFGTYFEFLNAQYP